MASASAIAIRRSHAQRRLQEEAQRMAKSKQVELPPRLPRSKDINIAAAQDLEELSEFLKAVNDSEGAPPVPQPAQPAAKAPPVQSAAVEEEADDDDEPVRKAPVRRHR